ncbi:hypothetical protein [Streptomyces chartreusis]|uniref:hypothetical protein n=1 Tax=Streptomyces chartreusis TaxID=1969 RepID=UPI0033B56C04
MPGRIRSRPASTGAAPRAREASSVLVVDLVLDGVRVAERALALAGPLAVMLNR